MRRGKNNDLRDLFEAIKELKHLLSSDGLIDLHHDEVKEGFIDSSSIDKFGLHIVGDIIVGTALGFGGSR
ncbi:MAG: hypothetical protein QW701_02635 [Candidatus Nezhaarchaeales archaeon]